MAITKLTSVSSLIPQLYERSLFVAREMNLMSNLVTNYTASGFMTRNVPIWPQVTAATVPDGTDYSNPTTMSKSSQATFTPGEVIAQALLTDQMVETDPDGAVQAASRELGGALATKIDTDLVGTFGSLSADVGGGAGNSATIREFGVAVSVLRNNLATPPYYAVVHPYHWHDVWVELGQPAAKRAFLGEQANAALRQFFVGRFMALDWYLSANISVDSGDDAVSGVFNREAIALDTRRAPRLENERDASLRATELNFTVGYAYGVLRSTYGVYYTADAATPT